MFAGASAPPGGWRMKSICSGGPMNNMTTPRGFQEFYDKFYKPGAYLRTHANHMADWHADDAV
jgi:hypothetical protein